jgi:copper chaperone NosL
MSRQRVLMLAAAACVAVALVLPLWEVRLVAPQYPEGLGLVIRVNTVAGSSPTDLQNINALNHYIGMKPIEPGGIPELRWMPWITVALTLGALGAALRPSRGAVLGWLGALLIVGAVGLWDFRRWEYDYGHDLDMENAIITIPGMSYQPPLIGNKQLLNITATSLPSAGGYALGLAFLLGVGALVGGSRRARVGKSRAATRATLAHAEI